MGHMKADVESDEDEVEAGASMGGQPRSLVFQEDGVFQSMKTREWHDSICLGRSL